MSSSILPSFLLYSQILKGVARYALVNAIANSLMSFEFSGVFYLGGVLLERGEITMLQLWRYVKPNAKIVTCHNLIQRLLHGTKVLKSEGGGSFDFALTNDLNFTTIVIELHILWLGIKVQVFFHRSYSAISFAASSLGYAASFAPDAKKASKAAKAIFEIIHRRPHLQPDHGDFPDRSFTGSIVFNNVRFRYPTRKQVPVLKVR